MVKRMEDMARLDLPANPAVLAVARTVVSSTISSVGIPLDERLDDVRLAVTEACNHVVRQIPTSNSKPRIELSCRATNDRLEILVEASFGQGDVHESLDEQISMSQNIESEQSWGKELMSALVDGLEIVDQEHRSAVALTFTYQGPNFTYQNL